MNRNNKTLVILTPGFPANEADSTCLPFPQLFVKTLQQLNPSLQIIVLAFQYPFIKTAYTWHGVKVITFNGRNRGKINRLLVWKSVWKHINKIVAENNVTGFLNFWLGECGLMGSYAAGKHRLPSYTWLLGQDARKNNRYFSLIKPAAQNLVALSDSVANECYRNYRVMPANIVPPGVETTPNDLLPLMQEDEVARNIDLLGVGSLIPLKRYDIFIRVVAALKLRYDDIKAVICGQGSEKDNLQRMIDDGGLSQNVELYGELSHKAVMGLMRRSKILLHPSSYEGFATVYTEALYAGAQVVGFCKPMNTIFKNQHVVKTIEEMISVTAALLSDNRLDHESVVTWPIETTCRKILALYGS